MSTVVSCMGESLIDFVPLHAPGQSECAFSTGENKPKDQAEELPKGAGESCVSDLNEKKC